MKDHFLLIEKSGENSGHHYDVRYALFKEHTSKTVMIARALYRKLPIGTLFEDQDFIVIGLEALWRTTEHYRPSVNSNFWSYASFRVTGSIIDEIRDTDHIARSSRTILKKIECKRLDLQQTLQREVTFNDACAALGINEERSEELSGMHSIGFTSLDSDPSSRSDNGESSMTFAEIIPDKNSTDPTLYMDEEGDILELNKLLDKLDPLTQSIVRLHYFSGLRLKDIAQAMRLTESRVCQILKEAIRELKKIAIENRKVFSQYCEK